MQMIYSGVTLWRVQLDDVRGNVEVHTSVPIHGVNATDLVWAGDLCRGMGFHLNHLSALGIEPLLQLRHLGA